MNKELTITIKAIIDEEGNVLEATATPDNDEVSKEMMIKIWTALTGKVIE